MRRLFVILLLLAQTAFLSTAQNRMTTKEYINIYSDLAIASMQEYKIPASIKMAQAILESASGNSRLATEANNHFGIKCKKEWTGETITHDDDAKNECFRKYSSAYDSYMDHNEFLAYRPYYKALFDLDITDYKGWAYGLKKAGYATNPSYAPALIKIIEDNKLYELDERALHPEEPKEVVEEVVKPEEPKEPVMIQQPTGTMYKGAKADKRNYVQVGGSGGLNIYINNNVKFIIARKGDTFADISKATNKSISKLLKYNELNTPTDQIEEGSIIYIASKKSKSSSYDFHRVLKGETLHYVSQKYGIKVEKLAKLNLYNSNYIIKVGQKMLLR